MKKLFSILALALVAGIMLWSGDALAANEAWTIAINKVTEAFQYSRKMIFIIGGFGLITLAFFAIFGKIQWKWFAALCVGLGIVAIAGYVIDYVTVDNTGSATTLGVTMTTDSGRSGPQWGGTGSQSGTSQYNSTTKQQAKPKNYTGGKLPVFFLSELL